MQARPAKSPLRDTDQYMPTLDGWRAIAILLVIGGHAIDDIDHLLRQWHIIVDANVFRFIGIHGVLIFFGLSGFLITSKLISEESRAGRIALGDFYIRRTFRIIPAALFFLGTVGLLSLMGVLDISLGRWLSALLFAANYSSADYSWYLGHFWSLAVEEHFYLVWPAFFIWLGLTRNRLVWAIGMACAVAVWRAVDFKFQVTGSSSSTFMGRTDIRVDHILWGVAVALAYADTRWGPSLKRMLADERTNAVLLVLLVGLVIPYSLDWKAKFLLLSLEGVVVPLALLSTLLNAKGQVGRLLESSPMRWIGRLSYSIYLWQQLFFVWADARVIALTPWQTFPLNLAGVAACSVVSYWLVEQPCLAFGRRVLARHRASRAHKQLALPAVS